MSPDRRSRPNVTPVTVAEAGRHMDKGREYLRAQTALAASDLDAAATSSGRARQAPHAATTA